MAPDESSAVPSASGDDLLAFDPSREVLVDPQRRYPRDPRMPPACVLCFFQDALARRADAEGTGVLRLLSSEIGDTPVRLIGSGEDAVALAHPGVGAPLMAGFLEELIALGGRRFVVCGGAGALHEHLELGAVVVPDLALRDEGTSAHYLPRGAPARPHPDALAAITAVLDERAVPHRVGTTWTTDAIYRETRPRLLRRREQGCLTVEMEVSAAFAVAEHRAVALGALLYCGDLLGDDEWQSRGWNTRADIRDHLLDLAIAAARRMPAREHAP
jgi:uridine phosphorylase